MKVAQFEQVGSAEYVVEIIEAADPPPPGAGQIQVAMKIMPINPADILLIEGRFGYQPEFPCTPGTEGVGEVEIVGPEVEGIAVGDLVVPLKGGLWCQRLTCQAANVIKLPSDCDIDQAALLKINPASADIMLSDMATLAPGDWVVQNAANSTVGRYVTQLAAERGLKTANIVRRQDMVETLAADGADLILIDDGLNELLAATFLEHSGGVGAKLALDAVGGPSTNHLAGCLTNGGVLVGYGMLSGRNCEIDPTHLLYRELTMRGFWLNDWFQQSSHEVIAARYDRLKDLMTTGRIHGIIESRYDLSNVKEALAHTAVTSRNGKVVLTA